MWHLLRRLSVRSLRRVRLGRGMRANPGRAVALGFLLSIGIGTMLLMLPISSRAEGGTDFLTAAFTATSAGCVTGLVVVDTETYWTGFGQAVLLVLMQIGGLGVMTFASLLGLLVAERLGLSSRLLVQAETRTVDASTLRRVLVGTIVISLAIQSVVWVALTLRFWLGYDESFGRAIYLGLFHAISAYNNAGFALWSDGVIGFAGDPLVLLPLVFALVLGGIGYPVMLEVSRARRARSWSLHTKLTLTATGLLLVLGPVMIFLTEWSNPRTLGGLPLGERALSTWFSGITPRTAGFNSIDYGAAHSETLLVTDFLMLIGGGSGGTAGGIKVTTLAVLFVAVMSEIRADPDVNAFGRRVSSQTVRQALSVSALAFVSIAGSTLFLLRITDFPLDKVLFEVSSALATTGLSTGITADLPPAGQVLLMVLMFLGRVGPVVVATALALRTVPRLYRNPEARPIIG